MALLQNNSDNIILAENDRMESVDDMENAKKSMEAEEAKGDAKEIAEKSEQAVDKPVEQNEAVEENAMDSSEKASPSNASATKQSSKDEKVDDEMPLSTIDKKDSAEEADEEEEDDDGEDEHEKKKGLYDLPLEVEGKRERHKVERIAIATPTPKKATSVTQMGDGVPLGEIAYIEDQLQKHRAEELKTMHRVLYGNPGKLTTIKKEIRKFTGFGFKEDSPEFKRKFALVSKLTLDQLKLIKNVLGLHSGGHTKDALVTTVMLFLMKTVDHARPVPKATKRKSSVKTPKSAKRAKKAKSNDEVVSDEEDEGDDDEEEEVEEKKEKPAAKTPAKTPAKASAKTPAKTSTKTPKKADSTKTPKKKKESTASKDTASKADTDSDDSGPKKKSKVASKASKKDSDDDTSSSSSTVETHEEASEMKTQRPTDKELEDVIEELLSQVDLSQVSMKQMCQAVIEKFPGTNIATRVDYLKSKIKQSLSTK